MTAMSNLRTEKFVMPAASLGGENPLPTLTPRFSATAGKEIADNVPLADRKFMGYGLDAGWLPHRGLDDYDRNRTNREFQAIVLENEYLRATILPEVGGRLWSLIHKPTGRDLLFVNPVFQPANLGVRGAWIAGGVEWNACVYGHTPYTCSPFFASVVPQTSMGDLCRIYEWDRTRGVPYQLDFSLPHGSQFLYVYVRLMNPHSYTIPMYWWSNIAVAESADVRVIAPAERAYTYQYGGATHAVPVPRHGEMDFTYSTNIPYGADYFFSIPDGTRPWIAALDGQGRGLVQTSTSRLQGRKIFAWGTSTGGRRWQDFLASPDHPYFEIQAGLARTQMECLPMPAGAAWDWIEAYGMLECDPDKVHGRDWSTAVREVSDRLEKSLPRRSLDDRRELSAGLADRPPQRILQRGSGWGALERLRRERSGEAPFCSPGLIFDDESLGEDQSPWLLLLAQGTLPERVPQQDPGTWMVQPEWRQLLESSKHDSRAETWFNLLHLGIMRYADGNLAGAEEAFQRSLTIRPSGWAYRNLALLRQLEHRSEEALALYEQAYRLLPELRPLLVEYCDALLDAGRFADVLGLIDSSPDTIRLHSRVRLLAASAGLALGQLERCQPILSRDYELVDIREGETSLTELWCGLQAQGKPHGDDPLIKHESKAGDVGQFPPLPAHLNFQVTPIGDSIAPDPRQIQLAQESAVVN